ncbi:ethanolamine ammonia-lyase subunit EutC [Thiofilum flexile]|uniref:ethanolamine ammonia-lyase subunit EutC n=1 Tax=Thiofilum flexile TaxID=125627 RepID=UPI00036FAC6C|nr:ethanolamine ammonia-lyase subunit EutC [Thiofilum flexile]
MSKLLPTDSMDDAVIENPWQVLRRFTDARIGLGRAGVSVPTRHLLDFQLAHAKAQDAVHTPLNSSSLIESLQQQPWCNDPVLPLQSQANDRATYLQRPDYGRRLDEASQQRLMELPQPDSPYDLAVVVVDGLSALAIEENTLALLQILIPALQQQRNPWSLAPISVVEQGRVAIGDHVGELLQARCVLVLIGERPGLSSPDSMGLYLTWAPKIGRADSQRNCISNVRRAGLQYADASRKVQYLLNEARSRSLSGVQLKDRTDDNLLEQDRGHHSFLVSRS